jgi:serine phosphatase RsbU (regulator of sigma subunit)/two-component sensor histidine kinase
MDRSARLSWKIGSLREEFDLLAQSKSKDEFGRLAAHIVRGSLLTGDAGLFERRDRFWHVIYQHHRLIESLPADEDSGSGAYSPFLLVAPLTAKGDLILATGPRLDGQPYSEEDTLAFDLIVELVYHAYVFFVSRQIEQRLIFQLHHRIAQLNSLVDATIELASKTNSAELFETALARITAMASASQGWIRMAESQGVTTIGFPENLPFPIPDSEMLSGECSSDTHRIQIVLSQKESRTAPDRFDDTDRILVDAVVRQMVAVLDRDALQKEAFAKRLLDQEVAIAAAIQKNLIPQLMPAIRGYEAYGINVPTKDVGGDFFDIFRIRDDRWCLTIADVAGKGIAAALLVSTLHAALRSYAESENNLAELVRKLNRLVFRSSTPDKFITFFVAFLEPGSGMLQCANAGHNPPFLISSDKSQRIGPTGPALGVLEHYDYRIEKFQLLPGNGLFMYTDGITEAENPDEDMFGEEKLSAHLSSPTKDLKPWCEALMEKIRAFAQNQPQSDDITMLWIRRSSHVD